MEYIIHLVACETGYTEEEVTELVAEMGYGPEDNIGMADVDEIVAQLM